MTTTRRRSAAAALITGSLVVAAAQTPTTAAAYMHAFSSPPCSGRLLTPSLPTTRTSSCVALQATRADDPRSSGSGNNNKNPYGGTGAYIPGRGSAQDDEAWFAQQVRMAETEKEFGSQQQKQQQFNRFGGQQQQQQRRNASSPPKAAAAAGSATRRGTSWARPNNPPPPPPAKRGDTNSRSPQAIPSGSSASSSWFGADRQAVTMPGAEKSSSAAVPQQSMARLSGPKPTVPPVPPPGIVGSGRGTTERVPYQPSPSAAAAAARGGGSTTSSSTRSIGGNERRSPGAVPFRGSSRSDDAVAPGAQRTPQQQQQQQQPQKKKDNWFRQLYLRQSEGQQQQQQQQRTSSGPTPVPGGGNSKPGSTQRVVAPIGSSPTARKNNNDSAAAAARKIQIKNTVAYAQSAIVGAFVGTWSIFPFTAFHYLVFTDYDYTTFAQWEWDLVASSVQGACFAVIYRYAMRQDLADKWVQRKVVLASVLLRSFVRVTVPFECAAGDDYPLYCADSAPLFVVNGGMMAEIAVNFAEGMALFGVTAIAMNWLLERNKIARY
mmetsp:Transcript_8941/g.18955  ORF Transcript_8941/g.18955 Transcript_8941/m.18955 type:complete len:548 (-) Transcript_8941:1684-3327(-)